MMLGVSVVYVQALQVESGNIQSEEVFNTVYDAWMLAVRYKFEETPAEYDITRDPKMKMIANLRGDDLHYFLDSVEAINQVQTTIFPPSSPYTEQTKGMTVSEEGRLVEIVTANVFATEKGDGNLEGLSEQEQAYITELQTILNAIIEGYGDEFFTAKYLEYRTKIIPFIEDTDAELFNPSQKTIDSYLEYFDIGNEQSVDLDPNRTLTSGCSTTNTIDNWPSKSSVFSGNTGSSWYEGKASDQNDCDIWVRYYMGSIPYYGRVSANTSAAQCVLDKTPQLRGDWSGNFNIIQYGKITVTWWWPFGCNTTGNALRSATKWRP